MDRKALKGLIYSRYNSQTELATRLQWSRQKLDKIVNGRKEPDLGEAAALAKALDTPLYDIALIFGF